MTATTSSLSGPEMTGTAPDSTSVVSRENWALPASLRKGQSLIQTAISSIVIDFADSLMCGRRSAARVVAEDDLDPAFSITC